MPSLADHHSSSLVKLLAIGDAWAGKTTACASLVTTLGLKLRILDFDNKLDPLAAAISAVNPELLANVEYAPFRDAYQGTAAGPSISGKPRAWADSIRLLDRWKYEEVDLGVPATWGPDCVLVIDSLSRWCDLAYDFCEGMNPGNDGRAIYGAAQDMVEKVLANLTSPHFQTNVVVICHGQYMDLPSGGKKIFPQGVGKALSPKIPQYFPNYVRITRNGDKRTIQLKSDNMIDLGTNLPASFGKDLDPSDGLAKIFAGLRQPPATTESSKPAEPAKPKAVTLVRR